MQPFVPLADHPGTSDWEVGCTRCPRVAVADNLRPLEFEAVLTLAGWVLGPPCAGDQSTDLCPDCSGATAIPSAIAGKLKL
jgi:hypothetical protein